MPEIGWIIFLVQLGIAFKKALLIPSNGLVINLNV